MLEDVKKEKPKSDYQTIKHKRNNYYLIKNKVYNINKSFGEVFGEYINEKVIEIKKEYIKLVELKP